MSLDFDALEQRILGVLVEKEMTVPESYPLTVNALVAGCNQKSNREPQMEVEPYEVEGALHALMDRGWVVRVERAGGRAHRFEHRMPEQLGVKSKDLALLAELLNRGPQTLNALKTRAGRMQPFQSAEEVEQRLQDLASRPVPYVARLERRPGEQLPRWTHLLGARKESAAPPGPEPAEPSDAPVAPPAGLGERVARLEAHVADLCARLERLEGEGRATG